MPPARVSPVPAIEKVSSTRSAATRRATWRLSAASVLAAVVMGIPVAFAITPLLYAAGLLLAEILSLWFSLPPAFWRNAGALAHNGLLAFTWLTQPAKIDDPQPIIIVGAVLLLPAERENVKVAF